MITFRQVKRRLAGAGLVAGIVAAFLVATALPAFADEPVVSGTTQCANGDHVVSWTIGNSQTDLPMGIDAITASIGAQTFDVTGYTAPVPANGSTNATTIVPGAMTGTVSLEVEASWTDGFSASAIAEVDLVESCTSDTTTTMSESATTVAGPPTTVDTTTSTTIEGEQTEGSTTTVTASTTISTSRTVVDQTTSTVAENAEGTTVTAPGSDETSTVAVAANDNSILPFTGGGGGATIGIASLFLGGIALVLSTRRKRRTR